MRAALVPVLLLALAAPAGAHPPEKRMPVDASRLAFLEGTWRSAWFEATYTAPTGGVVLSCSKELRDGKAVFIEFERFDVRDGVLTLQPYPGGKMAPVSFALHALAGDRAHFRNAAHDFPQDLVYERVAPDKLRIVLTGVEGGKPRELRFELERAR